MTASADRRWAVRLCRLLSDVPVRDQAVLVADRVADALGVPSPVDAAVSRVDTGALGEWPAPPAGWADPRLLGHLHEQAASPEDRKRRGAWYTPPSVVRGITAEALRFGAADDGSQSIIDPTCGGGAFLLAALDHLEAAGVEPAQAVRRVKGLDLDAAAVEVSRWAVMLWLMARVACGPEREAALAAIEIRRGDALTGLPGAWIEAPVAVVGNPPFASPLKAGAMPETAAEFRRQRTDLLGPYADLGAVHLLHAIESVAPGSTVALVQPQSVLAGRDTAGLRDWCNERGWLRGLWAARDALFDAGIRPCAPILHLGSTGDRADGPAASVTPVRAVRTLVAGPPTVALFDGADVEARGERPLEEWAPLAADALGAPRLPALAGETLERLATATAGFRDEHYALVAACREWDDDGPGPAAGADAARVITVGSVDPLQTDWGVSPYRFGGEVRLRPVVDRRHLAPKVQRWFDRVRRPKVLLATQAKLLEPVIDRDGTSVPATPLIAVMADSVDLDRVAAVLLAPPVALWAWRRWFGSAMSVDAVKLAARQVGQLPLPTDRDAWEAAAELIAGADHMDAAEAWDRSIEAAELMTRAYGADEQVLAWWRSRLKPRPATSAQPTPAPGNGGGPFGALA